MLRHVGDQPMVATFSSLCDRRMMHCMMRAPCACTAVIHQEPRIWAHLIYMGLQALASVCIFAPRRYVAYPAIFARPGYGSLAPLMLGVTLFGVVSTGQYRPL
jgi:hypothetical protein